MPRKAWSKGTGALSPARWSNVATIKIMPKQQIEAAKTVVWHPIKGSSKSGPTKYVGNWFRNVFTHPRSPLFLREVTQDQV
jgi:hypothetical protein